MLWDSIPVPKGTDADFAVAVTDDSLAPWIKKGGTAYLRRRTELYDGDIGLFETDGGIVFRQFCADSRGTVYLFAVNRAHAEDDPHDPAQTKRQSSSATAVWSSKSPSRSRWIEYMIGKPAAAPKLEPLRLLLIVLLHAHIPKKNPKIITTAI